MLEPEPLADVVETSTDRQRRGRQHGAVELGPETFAQNRSNIDRGSLQKSVLPPAEAVATAAAMPMASKPRLKYLQIPV